MAEAASLLLHPGKIDPVASSRGDSAVSFLQIPAIYLLLSVGFGRHV